MKLLLAAPFQFRLVCLSAALSLLVGGCSLQKDVEVPQPPFEAQLVVECYLVPGQPYRLVIQETTPFLAAPEPVVATDAIAEITGPRGKEVIRFLPSVDSSGQNLQAFSHTGGTIFDGRPGETYSLLVYDRAGRRVTGTTVVQAPVPVDTVEVAWNPDQDTATAEASLLTRYQDPITEGDAYRYQVLKLTNGRLERQQDFEFDDALFNGRPSGAGSSYRYDRGDTLRVRLYHIEKAYWRYLESVDGAQGANGNPFAQPASIKSTVQGGLGVFTNLAWDERRFILKGPNHPLGSWRQRRSVDLSTR